MKVAINAPDGSRIRLVPADREITIRDVLTHTSGLGASGYPPAGEEFKLEQARRPEEALAAFVPRLAGVPLDFQPGARWKYSANAGLRRPGRA